MAFGSEPVSDDQRARAVAFMWAIAARSSTAVGARATPPSYTVTLGASSASWLPLEDHRRGSGIASRGIVVRKRNRRMSSCGIVVRTRQYARTSSWVSRGRA